MVQGSQRAKGSPSLTLTSCLANQVYALVATGTILSQLSAAVTDTIFKPDPADLYGFLYSFLCCPFPSLISLRFRMHSVLLMRSTNSISERSNGNRAVISTVFAVNAIRPGARGEEKNKLSMPIPTLTQLNDEGKTAK